MHIDAAYAGSAFICPEFRHFLNGVEVKYFLSHLLKPCSSVESFCLKKHPILMAFLESQSILHFHFHYESLHILLPYLCSCITGLFWMYANYDSM